MTFQFACGCSQLETPGERQPGAARASPPCTTRMDATVRPELAALPVRELRPTPPCPRCGTGPIKNRARRAAWMQRPLNLTRCVRS